MRQLAKQITRHHSVLVLFYTMFFSLITACEHQSLELTPAKQLELTQATQFENSLEGLIKAIQKNNLPEVKRLTKVGISATESFTKYRLQQTPVHLASEHGCLDIIRYLISELKINPNITPKGQSKTPLHVAAWYGDKNVVAFLIQAGANPTAKAHSEINLFIQLSPEIA
jgi:Ankyrin repeats (3 copies)